ncbi:MAG: cupin [Phycisphaerae bacterium]|nr:cupin [Phycisphaerae bacterium]|tara:strand:- start:1019 stop:1393 length:375 start_codon:yes stop_codon:yes gene_type:complete
MNGQNKRIRLSDALATFSDHWSPRIIAELNGQQVKLAKFIGAFDWHSHADEDEMFLVIDGSFTMEFRDRSVELNQGDMIVVPRGVEHRPVAEKECSVMLVEPAGLVNTGDLEASEKTTTGIWLD